MAISLKALQIFVVTIASDLFHGFLMIPIIFKPAKTRE